MVRAALVLPLLLGGCSLLFVKSPPSQPTPTCDDSRTLVGLDASVAALSFFPAVIGVGFGVDHRSCVNGVCEDKEGNPEALEVGLIFTGLMVAEAVSAGVGYARTKKCRARKRDYYRMYPPQPYHPPAPQGPPSTAPSP